jgi:DNA mismatch repair protein MutL
MSASKIRRLSKEVVNKIAAGEVVEHPASIVKELVENSLDAGATRIEVTIEGGGHRLIRVEDDGCGMSPEDARLCLERHATSKIRTEADLESLTTFGFRGEALAAISAVSEFELKTSDGVAGTKINSEGEAEPCARNPGTTIEVRSLFYNVPARKKFLKPPSTSSAQVSRTMETLAIANPGIAFTLTSNGKVELDLRPEEKLKRIRGLLGGLNVEIVSPFLWGLLGAPEEAKINRRGQYLFINKRPIVSPLISRAVKMGYGTRIAESAHPSFVLFLELPPDEIDVNVHPQKKEARFANEGALFSSIERSVSEAFGGPVFESPLSFETPTPISFIPLPETTPVKYEAQTLDFGPAERALAVIGTHLLLQREGALLLIDLQAAHTLVLFEGIKSKKGAKQALLWPLEVEVEEDVSEELGGIGIECRLIGKRTLAIDALPQWLEPESFPDFFQAWKEGKRIDVAASRSTKKKYTMDEALALWKECRGAKRDPLGKLIWVQIKNFAPWMVCESKE